MVSRSCVWQTADWDFLLVGWDNCRRWVFATNKVSAVRAFWSSGGANSEETVATEWLLEKGEQWQSCTALPPCSMSLTSDLWRAETDSLVRINQSDRTLKFICRLNVGVSIRLHLPYESICENAHLAVGEKKPRSSSVCFIVPLIMIKPGGWGKSPEIGSIYHVFMMLFILRSLFFWNFHCSFQHRMLADASAYDLGLSMFAS